METQLRFFICEKCGLAYSLNLKNSRNNILFGEKIEKNKDLLTSFSTSVGKHIVTIYIFKGICQNCQKGGGKNESFFKKNKGSNH